MSKHMSNPASEIEIHKGVDSRQFSQWELGFLQLILAGLMIVFNV